ncbi:hypothetical protein [Methylobacterium sp. Leaf87]|uniref:TRAFAC clade GTPase domain-containing protein n=1 Tax=Methylobacterium sp. Leaf87 TaxID=1736243 RepID=UPI0009E9F5AC|nr:hypothetical protein [Methylobacterium sp. Leaf87]
MDECPQPTCFAPDTSCALGHLELAHCPRWAGSAKTPPAKGTKDEEILLPWTGNALGLADIDFITGREKPLTVAIAGPESAGKTTLLGAWYLLLGRGMLTEEHKQFNGSYSLAGWEAIAGSLRWQPGQLPSFPPHTSTRDSRVPGLLHLALREAPGQTRDLFFADAPGAWFQTWAVNAESSEAQGARWLARHADVFLIVADRQALAGPKLGQARNKFQLLTKRISAERRGRPVALVWTKGDVAVNKEMETVIRSAMLDDMPNAAEFTTSVFSGGNEHAQTGAGFVPLFAWLLALDRPGTAVARKRGTTTDPLFLYGRR